MKCPFCGADGVYKGESYEYQMWKTASGQDVKLSIFKCRSYGGGCGSHFVTNPDTGAYIAIK